MDTAPEQVIALQLGQSGIQVGIAYWELICLEQGIAPDGTPIVIDNVKFEHDKANALFDIGNMGTYIPRSIMIDSEPSVVDEIKTGPYRELFNSNMIINDFEDAANNHARGSYTIGRQMIKIIIESIRKTAEHTDNLRSFFVMNSVGGGTGSGLSPLIFLTLLKDYPKITRSAFYIAPGNNHSSAIVEPYNMVLHNFATAETVDVNFMFDNESIFDICCKKLLINSPSFTEINRILALMMSSISSSMRYSTTIRSSIDSVLTNLIPYPRIHYPIVRYAPLNHFSRSTYDKMTTTDLTKELFSKNNQSMNVDTNKGLFIALIINYQGLVNPNEIYKSIEQHKIANPNKFVDWSPTGFKVGICNQLPTLSPLIQLSPTDQSATMFINSTAINQFFFSQRRKFDLLFRKKCFIHWYSGEGMEESEFNESREELEMIIEDFIEIGLSDQELVKVLSEDEPIKGSSHRSSTGSNLKEK